MMEQEQLAHSEGEYIYPENAGWYWLYLDLLSWIPLIGILSKHSGGCSMVYQHVPAKQYTKKAELFSKRL
jgi:hypothetical protein